MWGPGCGPAPEGTQKAVSHEEAPEGRNGTEGLRLPRPIPDPSTQCGSPWSCTGWRSVVCGLCHSLSALCSESVSCGIIGRCGLLATAAGLGPHHTTPLAGGTPWYKAGTASCSSQGGGILQGVPFCRKANPALSTISQLRAPRKSLALFTCQFSL